MTFITALPSLISAAGPALLLASVVAAGLSVLIAR